MSNLSDEPAEDRIILMLSLTKRLELLMRESEELDAAIMEAEERANRQASGHVKIERLGGMKSANQAEIEAVEGLLSSVLETMAHDIDPDSDDIGGPIS